MAPIFLALANLAPILFKYATGEGSTTDKVLDAAADIARTVAGKEKTQDAIDTIRQDPKLLADFQLKVTEQQMAWDQMYLMDIKDARNRDAVFVSSGKHNYRADTMYVLAVAVIVGLTYAIFTAEGIDEFTKGIITLILGRFLGYLDNIYNFEFGSTKANRTKDDTINKLSSGG